MGLQNVRARLQALFAGDASVRWGEENGRWRVDISLPVVRANDGRVTEDSIAEPEQTVEQ